MTRLFRLTALILLLALPNIIASQINENRTDKLRPDRSGDRDTLPISCSISIAQKMWNSRNPSSLEPIALQIQAKESTQERVMASIHLVAAASRNAEGLRDTYWAPFDIATGDATAEWHSLESVFDHNSRVIHLRPSRLLWAPTKSSIWPSDGFNTIPPGKYDLTVEIEGKTGGTVKSNAVRITLKR
jgi:hypothetical protein